MDDTGNAVVVWMQGGSGPIKTRRGRCAAPSPRPSTVRAGPQRQTRRSVAANATGDTVAVWRRTRRDVAASRPRCVPRAASSHCRTTSRRRAGARRRRRWRWTVGRRRCRLAGAERDLLSRSAPLREATWRGLRRRWRLGVRAGQERADAPRSPSGRAGDAVVAWARETAGPPGRPTRSRRPRGRRAGASRRRRTCRAALPAGRRRNRRSTWTPRATPSWCGGGMTPMGQPRAPGMRRGRQAGRSRGRRRLGAGRVCDRACSLRWTAPATRLPCGRRSSPGSSAVAHAGRRVRRDRLRSWSGCRPGRPAWSAGRCRSRRRRSTRGRPCPARGRSGTARRLGRGGRPTPTRRPALWRGRHGPRRGGHRRRRFSRNHDLRPRSRGGSRR